MARIRKVTKAKTNPDWIAGLTNTAKAIAEHFKMPCSKQTIKYWQTRNPPFPAPAISGSNRYSRSECFAWIKTYGPKRDADESDVSLEARAREAELNTILHKEESERLDLEEKKGSLIDKHVSRNSIVAFATSAKAMIRAEVETNCPDDRKEKLLALGVSQETVAIFHAWDLERGIQTITKIEKEFAKPAKE